MILNNVTLLSSNKRVNIAIEKQIIKTVSANRIEADSENFQLHFSNAIAFPGLINSHDHLDFNCFPSLGNGGYQNYKDWGTDIHTSYKTEIENVLKIPIRLRSEWGIYKNLLCGITTVVNHGLKYQKNEDCPITIEQSNQSIHSVQLDKLWKLKLNNPVGAKRAAVIHIGEGVDSFSFDEIEEFLHHNMLHRRLIGVHAVAMNKEQASAFDAIVWCPDSNLFLLNKTADIALLKQSSKIIFGTDSTVSSHWNIWHHLRLAKSLKVVNDLEIIEMVTTNAAETWRLNNGGIIENKLADIVVADHLNETSVESFFSTNPETIQMIIYHGEIRFFDEQFLTQLENCIHTVSFSRIEISGRIKYIVGNLKGLIDEIRTYYADANFPGELKLF